MRELKLVVLCAFVAVAGFAGEGMWLPDQLPKIGDRLREAGLDTSPEVFADLTGHPMGAIVSLGGCSASFVSPRGLVATNHHCAYGTIQYNSSPERNLLREHDFTTPRPANIYLSSTPVLRLIHAATIR